MAIKKEDIKLTAARARDRLRLLEGQKRRNASWSAAQRKQAFGVGESKSEQLDFIARIEPPEGM